MKFTLKKVLALALSALMLLTMTAMLAGCGETANTGDDASKESAAPKKEVITVGYTIYEPMNYLDESGTLVGFDTELAQKVFENLGYEVIFKEIKWENKYTDLSSGNIDCIWNGFTANSADDDGVLRSEKVDFSYNYMENLQVVVIKDGTSEDLTGLIGVAEAGSAGESYAKDLEGPATIKGVTKQTDALLEVNTGSADFAVLDAQLANSYCGKGDYASLKIVDALSSDVEYYAIGFAKGSDLTAKVNGELEKLAADGTIKALGEKYGVENSVITDFSSQA